MDTIFKYTDTFSMEDASKGIFHRKEVSTSGFVSKIVGLKTLVCGDYLICSSSYVHSKESDRKRTDSITEIEIQNNKVYIPIFVEKIDELIYTTELISNVYLADVNREFELGLKPLFKKIIELNSYKDYNLIDSIIEKFIQKDFSIKSTIGILLITNKIKSELRNRNALIKYSKKVAYDAGYTSEQLSHLLTRFS